jgi:hypothetical protein
MSRHQHQQQQRSRTHGEGQEEENNTERLVEEALRALLELPPLPAPLPPLPWRLPASSRTTAASHHHHQQQHQQKAHNVTEDFAAPLPYLLAVARLLPPIGASGQPGAPSSSSSWRRQQQQQQQHTTHRERIPDAEQRRRERLQAAFCQAAWTCLSRLSPVPSLSPSPRPSRCATSFPPPPPRNHHQHACANNVHASHTHTRACRDVT